MRAALASGAATVALSCLLLAGCQSPIYPVPQVDFATATAPALPASGPIAIPEQVPLPALTLASVQATGAIYQAAR